MMPLIVATVVTLTTYLICSLAKKKEPWHRYVVMFCVLAGIGYLFSSMRSEASEIPRDFDHCLEMAAFAPTIEKERAMIMAFVVLQGNLNEKQKKEFLAKAKKHKKDGCDCYGDAKRRCALFPSIDDQRKAEIAFETGALMATQQTPYTKIVTAVTNLLIQYGLAVLREWDYIDYKMKEASHNFEQYEWYMEILTKDNNS